jgi:chorismate synthase
MNTFGTKIKLSIFGESHGNGIGIVIDGLPPGIKIDRDYIATQMARRAPGRDEFSTPRKELDGVEILSGLFNGFTTGAPLTGLIRNTNTRSQDYDRVFRPSHADWPAYVKYMGFEDYRGGGHFSARITAPLMWAGAICKQVLKETYDMKIYGRIQSIANVTDMVDTDDIIKDARNNAGLYQQLIDVPFPALEPAANAFKEAITAARMDLDSVGGTIEIVALDVPAGLGSPFFDSFESTLAHLLFSVPGVKGVEFGAGFDITKLRGSVANDQLEIVDDKVKALSNNSGGIQGGITTGMPIVARVALKPTASIGKKQHMVDAKDAPELKSVDTQIHGRHDPCIVPRAVPIVESCMAIVLLDQLI